MSTLWKWLRALSLDVCVSACAVLYAFGYESGQPLRQFPPYFILVISVWILYTADHLWDALRIQHRAHTFRHRVHQRFFKRFVLAVDILLLIDLGLLWQWAPLPVVYGGLYLGFFSAIHFALELLPYHWVDISKELRVALIYVAGASLWHWAPLAPSGFTSGFWVLGISFLLLAWCNLLIIAAYERHSDQQDGQRSLAQRLPEASLRRLIYALLGLATVISAALWQSLLLMLVLWCMSLTLLAVLLFPSFFAKKERYRIVSDSAFLYPLLLLPASP